MKQTDEAISEETAATVHVGTNRDLDEAYALYESLMEETISVDDVCNTDVIQRITTILEEKIDSLQSSRTASLWLQYMKMVDMYFASIYELNILAIGHCIFKLFPKCFLTYSCFWA